MKRSLAGMKGLALLAVLGLASCARAPTPAASATSAAATGEEPTVLVYATPYSPNHPFSRADRRWMDFVEQRSGGSLKIQPSWSGALLSSDKGLAPRALRDIKAAVAAGRFTVDDPELALAVAGGALLGVGHLLQAQPQRDVGTTSDAATESVLRLFGMSADDAREVCALPLPDFEF